MTIRLTDGQLSLLFALAREDWPTGLRRGLCHVNRVSADEFDALLIGRLVVERRGRIILAAAGRRHLLRVVEGRPAAVPR